MTPITLRKREYLHTRGWSLIIQLLLFGIPISALYYFSTQTAFETKLYFGVLVALLLYILFSYKVMNGTKLVFDEFGISYSNGLPLFMKRNDNDWHISWAEIQKVSHADSFHSARQIMLPLQIKLLNGIIEVIPIHWINPKEKGNTLMFSGFTFEQYKNNALIKIFSEKELIKVREPIQLKIDGFDVTSSPITVFLTVVLGCSLFYIIFEFLAKPEFYIDSPPYKLIAILMSIAAVISFILMLLTDASALEKVSFALMITVAFGLVSHPLLLRINSFTDDKGLQTIDFVKSSIISWEPKEENSLIPRVRFSYKSSEYWRQFEQDDVKQFQIRKGGLGFYQINMKPIYEEQRIFYHSRY